MRKRIKKAYKPRQTANPLRMAMIRVGKLTPDEIARLMNPTNDSFDLMLRGELDLKYFKYLADVLNIAQVLASPGFNIVSDHMAKFVAGQEALAALADRRRNGGSWTCRAAEIEAVRIAIEFHRYQLDYASAGELERATKAVDNYLRGAESGSPGKQHVHLNFS